MFNFQEKAVRCFETWSGTTVSIHGYCKEYELMFDISRSKHQHPLCMQIKRTQCGAVSCPTVDMAQLASEIHRFRSGGIKRCPSGLLEFFMPVWDGIRLQAILFAGVRRAPENWIPAVPMLDLGQGSDGCTLEAQVLKDGEEEMILEGLAQLAARLKQFVDPLRDNVLGDKQDMPRDMLIRYLICRHYSKPGQSLDIISKALSLSKSRTLHVIKEETGQNLLELLNSVRLNNACFLLSSSLKPVHVISEECGFGNISNFFRLFRKTYGVTPLNFRKINCKIQSK